MRYQHVLPCIGKFTRVRHSANQRKMLDLLKRTRSPASSARPGNPTSTGLASKSIQLLRIHWEITCSLNCRLRCADGGLFDRANTHSSKNVADVKKHLEFRSYLASDGYPSGQVAPRACDDAEAVTRLLEQGAAVQNRIVALRLPHAPRGR